MWGAFFCSAIFYFLLVYSALSYFVGMITEFSQSGSASRSSSFVYLDGAAVRLFLLSLPALVFLLAWSWTGPSVVSGFGHLSFTSFERKITLFTSALFASYLSIFSSSFYLSNSKSFDLLLTLNQLTVWLIFLFYVSNILTLSFVIEVLTGLITLLLVTSHAPAYHGGISGIRYQSASTALLPSYFFSLLFFF